MKRRMLLRVLLDAYIAWLREQMEPAGKASLLTLAARGGALIDALPNEHGPDLARLETLDAESLIAGLDWLLTALRTGYAGDWAPLTTESLRLLLHRNADQIVLLAQPPLPPPPTEGTP